MLVGVLTALAVAAGFAVFSAAGGSRPGAPAPTTAGPLEPPTGSPATPTTPSEATLITGHLPDGTHYTIGLPSPRSATRVEAVSGFISFDPADEPPEVLGDTTFLRQRTDAPSFDGITLQVPTGDWTLLVRLYPTVRERLGAAAAGVVSDGIRSAASEGLPHLSLDPPLRWARDDEIPGDMQVAYSTFVVRRGCGDLAAACSPTGRVQVIPSDQAHASELDDAEMWVEPP